MKNIVSSSSDTCKMAAEHIIKLINKKPNACIAISSEPVLNKLFAELAARYALGDISFKDVRVFAATEFMDVDSDKSCEQSLKSDLLDKIDINPENCFFLNSDKLEEYDAKISAAGGIDIAIISLGLNASIALNEPATLFDTYTHIQKLTNPTKRQYAPVFGAKDKVPDYGITMGIKTLVSAREIILLALGEEYSDAVFKMVFGKTITYVPASFLQIPLEVTTYLDEAAASKI